MADYLIQDTSLVAIADAIRAKTSVSSTMTPSEMASKISGIVTLSGGTADATATAAQILSGKTAYVKGAKVTGTMTNRGAVTQALNAGGSYTIPAGYHNGSGKVTANSLSSQTAGTAVAANILTGKTAWVGGSKITGSMPTPSSSSNITLTSSDSRKVVLGKDDSGTSGGYWVTANSDGTSRVCTAIPTAGYYSTSDLIAVPASSVRTSLTSDANAAAGHILSGKTAYVNGSKITGTIATKTSSNLTASGATVSVPAGYYASTASKSVSTATQATPSISISTGGLITASATQTAGYVAAGTKSGTKQMTVKAATTWTPKTTNQTIASGTYLTGTQTIKGDANLIASNIKSGVSIFGVTGTVVSPNNLHVSKIYGGKMSTYSLGGDEWYSNFFNVSAKPDPSKFLFGWVGWMAPGDSRAGIRFFTQFNTEYTVTISGRTYKFRVSYNSTYYQWYCDMQCDEAVSLSDVYCYILFS